MRRHADCLLEKEPGAVADDHAYRGLGKALQDGKAADRGRCGKRGVRQWLKEGCLQKRL